MNRTERLYALAEQLRSAGDGGQTSRQLAAKFEVTTRTIKRDIGALQQAGMPICAEAGPSGGYRLLATARDMPPVTFTAGEAAAVAIALGTQRDLPFASEGATALAKILRMVSAPERTDLAALLERVGSTTSPVRSRAARTLDEGIRRQVVVSITYAGAQGAVTERRVDPIQYAHVGGRWYLHAFCHLRRAGRWFRLDRIQSARLTKTKADSHDEREVIGEPPPEASSLARRWQDTIG